MEKNTHSNLENELHLKIRKIKLITLAVALLFTVLFIIFMVIRENTKIVTEYESGVPFIGGYKSVTYNNTYSLIAGFCFIVFMMSFVFLLCECIFTRVNCVSVCGSDIILYRGPFSIILYVDGNEASRSRYFLEAPLANGETVTVSLSRNTLFAHMSFSGGHQAIDL